MFIVFFRNRAKKNSFTTLNLTFLLLKTMFDSISRILLYSTWLYVINDGQFSSTKTLIAYYSTLMVLFVLNTIFSKHLDYKSTKTWIGRKQHFNLKIQVLSIFYFQKYFSTQQVLFSHSTTSILENYSPKENQQAHQKNSNMNTSQHFSNKLFTSSYSLS